MTTPGSIVIPAAFVLAARLDATDVIELPAAILAGYEAMIRLGRTINGPAILYRSIWPTYFTAAFGTAAVTAPTVAAQRAKDGSCARARADDERTLGRPHHAATTARWLSAGQAARNGVTAALAARSGFTADLDLLRAHSCLAFTTSSQISPQ